MGDTMPRRHISFITAVAAGLLAAEMVLDPNEPLVADDCLVQPGGPSAPGGHWYYHSDSVNNRKCWYFVQPQTKMPQVQAPEAQPSSDGTSQPTLLSFFSSLTAGFTGTNPSEARVTTVGDERSNQAARSDSPKNVASLPAAKRAGTGPDPNSSATIKPKQLGQLPAKPRGQQANERASPPLTEADRDALFKEFLRWKERQISQAP
jgi:hypothetical protein